MEVTATFHGGFSATVTARDHSVEVDEPETSGGNDDGFMPTELLFGGLASCFALALGHAARKRDVDLPNLRVTVTAHRPGSELRYDRVVVSASRRRRARDPRRLRRQGQALLLGVQHLRVPTRDRIHEPRRWSENERATDRDRRRGRRNRRRHHRQAPEPGHEGDAVHRVPGHRVLAVRDPVRARPRDRQVRVAVPEHRRALRRGRPRHADGDDGHRHRPRPPHGHRAQHARGLRQADPVHRVRVGEARRARRQPARACTTSRTSGRRWSSTRNSTT